MKATRRAGESPNNAKPYRCFLLRCRLEEGASPGASPGAGRGSEPGWRFTVQEAGMDEARHCFVSLKDLEAYLEAELGLPGERAAGEEA